MLKGIQFRGAAARFREADQAASRRRAAAGAGAGAALLPGDRLEESTVPVTGAQALMLVMVSSTPKVSSAWVCSGRRGSKGREGSRMRGG